MNEKVKKQHYVPRTYLKSWETILTGKNYSNPKIYVFNNSNIGVPKAVESVLWRSNFYTVGFEHNYIFNNCEKIKIDFTNKICDLMRESDLPVYSKLDNSIIKTKENIYKYMSKIYEWTFYYDDGRKASNKSILNQIANLKSYVLEKGFGDYFERKWNETLSSFLTEVKNGKPCINDSKSSIIQKDLAVDMIRFFLMMMCRNPSFDAWGIYTVISEEILIPQLQELYSFVSDNCHREAEKDAEFLLKGVWLTELYRIIFGSSEGVYSFILNKAIDNLHPVLFEANKEEYSFITSDNPAFCNISLTGDRNYNGYIFPLTPKYLLFLVKGTGKINEVVHMYADRRIIGTFNSIIKDHRNDLLISNNDKLDC